MSDEGLNNTQLQLSQFSNNKLKERFVLDKFFFEVTSVSREIIWSVEPTTRMFPFMVFVAGTCAGTVLRIAEGRYHAVRLQEEIKLHYTSLCLQ